MGNVSQEAPKIVQGKRMLPSQEPPTGNGKGRRVMDDTTNADLDEKLDEKQNIVDVVNSVPADSSSLPINKRERVESDRDEKRKCCETYLSSYDSSSDFVRNKRQRCAPPNNLDVKNIVPSYAYYTCMATSFGGKLKFKPKIENTAIRKMITYY